MKCSIKFWIPIIAGLICLLGETVMAQPWVVFEGKEGPGRGKHIVFLAGDEEYRSEDSMPQLAKILAVHHGFKCTMLFAVNKETGEIDPQTLDNIPGLEALEKADLMVMFLRFRELPDDQMKYIIDYTNSGKPIVGLRTSTHAFNYVKHKDSPYAKYSFNDKEFDGGYGRQVFGAARVRSRERQATRQAAGALPRPPAPAGFPSGDRGRSGRRRRTDRAQLGGARGAPARDPNDGQAERPGLADRDYAHESRRDGLPDVARSAGAAPAILDQSRQLAARREAGWCRPRKRMRKVSP